MNGIRKEIEYSVLNEGEVIAVENHDKAERCCNAFIKVTRTENLLKNLRGKGRKY